MSQAKPYHNTPLNTQDPGHPTTYPAAARAMHWLMALGVLWMLTSAVVHAWAKDSGLDAFMWPTHKHVGVLLMVLVVVRMVLAVLQRTQRPPSHSVLSHLGHLGLYALMVAIPTLGILRQIGSGRAFSPFGLPLFPGFSEPKIDWMVNLGNDWHGELGWTLLALVLVHIAMVKVHWIRGEHHIWHRMRG